MVGVLEGLELDIPCRICRYWKKTNILKNCFLRDGLLAKDCIYETVHTPCSPVFASTVSKIV